MYIYNVFGDVRVLWIIYYLIVKSDIYGVVSCFLTTNAVQRINMPFRGRSFRPRTAPPPWIGRGGPPGSRGSFGRFTAPQSNVGRPTTSSRHDYPVSERTSFEDRNNAQRARSPAEAVCLPFADYRGEL